ncbi:MAG TPA: hypothetical protein ENJ34_03595 [Epsilonproteobacteria bacterium]|nr:hypothetical protein [Campylobacterota bacterium]
MSAYKKHLPLALFAGFIFIGLVAFFQSKPSNKNERIYKVVQVYSPYYLDKRLGGLTIRSKEDENFKEKPTNLTLFGEFERLEKAWGKAHLSVKNNTLIIKDNQQKERKQIPLHTQDELHFIQQYYGVN